MEAPGKGSPLTCPREAAACLPVSSRCRQSLRRGQNTGYHEVHGWQGVDGRGTLGHEPRGAGRGLRSERRGGSRLGAGRAPRASAAEGPRAPCAAGPPNAVSEARRIVRATTSFFKDLDRQLPSERGPKGEPSTNDFQVFELLRIVDRVATHFD